jgi:hypothetical protein
MSELIKDLYSPLADTLINQGYTPEMAWQIVSEMFGDANASQ